jgi:hypothetical protein
LVPLRGSRGLSIESEASVVADARIAFREHQIELRAKIPVARVGSTEAAIGGAGGRSGRIVVASMPVDLGKKFLCVKPCEGIQGLKRDHEPRDAEFAVTVFIQQFTDAVREDRSNPPGFGYDLF